jgi:hypothetical protein
VVALDICAHLSNQRSLASGFAATAEIKDDDFAEALKLTVSSNTPTKLYVTQHSFLSNDWQCVTNVNVTAKNHQELLIPKIKGLVSLELVASHSLTLESMQLVKAAVGVQQEYFDNFFPIEAIKFGHKLQFHPLTPRTVSLIAKNPAANNASFLTKLSSLYAEITLDTATFQTSLTGKCSYIEHTAQYAVALKLPANKLSVKVFKLTADVAPSRIFTNEQIIHVKL